MLPRVQASLAFVILAATSILPRPAGAVPDLASVDGSVRASTVIGNTLYLGGTFNHVTRTRGGMILLDPVTGETDAMFPRVQGTVYAVVSDGTGGYYLGGEFSAVGGQARSNLARVLADRTVASWAPAVNGAVSALAVGDGSLYVGGDFTAVGLDSRDYLAAFDVATGALRGNWKPVVTPEPGAGEPSPIRAIAVHGTVVYLGGTFVAIEGSTRERAAAVRTNNGNLVSWQPILGGAAPMSVQDIVIVDGTIYIGGLFLTVNGLSRPCLAALLPDGTVTPWAPSAGLSVGALHAVGGTMYVGGSFSFAGGQARNRLAAFDLATGSLTAWNPDAGGFSGNEVLALASAGGAIIATGRFTTMGGTARLRIAALDPTTGAVSPWDPRLDGAGNALATSGSDLVCGGAFIGVNLQPRQNLCAIDLDTGEPTPWDPSLDGMVYALASAGDSIFVGGSFDTIGGVRRSNFAALDAGSGNVLPFNPGQAGGTVHAFAVEPARVLVGGAFSQFGGAMRSRLAAFERGTGTITTWNAAVPNATVSEIASDGNVVYIAGGFSQVGGLPRTRLAALDADDGELRPWNPLLQLVDTPFALSVEALALGPGVVYAGGMFDRANGLVRRRAVALDADSGETLPWNPDLSGWVYKVLVDGDRIYLGGQLSTPGPEPRDCLASVDTDSGNASAWRADLDGPANRNVQTIDRVGSFLIAGGTMNAMGPRVGRNLGIIEADLSLVGVPPAPYVAAVAPRIHLPAPHPVRFASRLRFELPHAGPVNLDVIDLRGRRVRRLLEGEWRPAGTQEVALDRKGLAPGVYFIDLRSGPTSARGRFAVLPG